MITCLLAGWLGSAHAQEPYFRVEHFPSAIPDLKHVTGIASDKNHCIWFATQAGIYRYDGSKFRHYSVQTTPLLKFERMSGIAELNSPNTSRWLILDAKSNYYQVDDQSRLQNYYPNAANGEWMGYQIYTSALFNRFRKNKTLDSLWSDIHRLYTITNTRRTFIEMTTGEIFTMNDKDTILTNAVRKITKVNTNQFLQKVTSVADDFFLINSDGLLRWNENRLQMESVSLKGDIAKNKSIDHNKLGFLRFTLPEEPLIWYEGNIYEVIPTSTPGIMNTRLLIKSFVDEAPLVVFYSKPRQLFISFYQKNGIQFYKPAQFSLLSWGKPLPRKTASLDYFYSLIPESNGFLTINDAGILWLGANGESRLLSESNAFEYYLFKDRLGNIWFEEKNGQFYYLRAGDLKQVKVNLQLPYEVMVGVSQVSDTEYYFLTNRKLYQLIVTDGTVKSSRILFTSPTGTEMHALYKKDKRTFWFGHDTGITEYDIATGKGKEIEALKNNYIRAITKLDDSTYLVGSYDKGIYLSQGNKWIHLTSSDRKMPSSAHAFIIDRVGASVWVSSNEGIVRIPMEQLLSKDTASTRNIIFRHFKDFGPDISVEFNGSSNVSGAKLSDTCFAFANANGLVIFNPLERVSYPLPENVLVESAGSGDSLQLKSGTRQFAFDPIIPYYGNLQDLEILYYLTNTDEQWHRFVPNSIISYNNIGPGNHELKFRIKYHHEPGGKEILITAKKLDLPYRWYQKTWFQVLGTVLGLGIIILLHNFRLWYLLKRKRELEKIVKAKTSELQETNDTLVDVIDELSLSESNLKQSNFLKDEYYAVLTHDLRSPLKFLSFNLGQLVDQTRADGDDNLKKGLFAAYQCSTDVHKLIDEFVYWIRDNEHQLTVKPEPTRISAVMDDIKNIHSYALLGNHNKLVTDFPETIVFNTDPKLLFIILRNAIDNANKYTLKGTITVSAKIESANLEVTVADTGRGMKKELIEELVALQYRNEQLNYKARKSLGFYIMSMLIKKLGGRFTITSEKEEGTILRFIIPELK